jgi:predicted Zn-dependent protease
MEEQSQALLAQDPGAEQFVAVAEELRLEGIHSEALVILLKGLSRNPSNYQGRLLLARVLYECDCVPYAVRELTQLCAALPNNPSLLKLYRALSGRDYVVSGDTSSSATVMAESEIDFDAIEELGDEQG